MIAPLPRKIQSTSSYFENGNRQSAVSNPNRKIHTYTENVRRKCHYPTPRASVTLAIFCRTPKPVAVDA